MDIPYKIENAVIGKYSLEITAKNVCLVIANEANVMSVVRQSPNGIMPFLLWGITAVAVNSSLVMTDRNLVPLNQQRYITKKLSR